ncbi:unnamed protein product [Vitrella brassicaformis CCMP3155]|uniref:Uncharacterized protein n=1 Tax=Vitrella brassicaformis (strain CCMP3155) TaxID=1169540 RepID=A0A0G4EUF7_VITBC|nr:unnamed protein product [Vitrella brassicaformis CCMP3155]|eukprot:CEM02284.1 unnamed protein product [Vitrella brassicaformis CCMP3155]
MIDHRDSSQPHEASDPSPGTGTSGDVLKPLQQIPRSMALMLAAISVLLCNDLSFAYHHHHDSSRSAFILNASPLRQRLARRGSTVMQSSAVETLPPIQVPEVPRKQREKRTSTLTELKRMAASAQASKLAGKFNPTTGDSTGDTDIASSGGTQGQGAWMIRDRWPYEHFLNEIWDPYNYFITQGPEDIPTPEELALENRIGEPLNDAVNASNYGFAERWIRAGGISPDTPDKSNRRPLDHAIDNVDIKMVRLLLDLGADLNYNTNKDEGISPLHRSISKGSRAIFDLLMDRGADPTRTDDGGRDALTYAAIFGELAMLKRLMTYNEAIVRKDTDEGASISTSTTEEATGDFRSTLNVNRRDKMGRSAFDYVCLWPTHRWLTYLEAGHDMRFITFRETTQDPQVRQRYAQIAELLLDAGADFQTTDKDNRSCLDYACHWGVWEVVEMLIKRGANVNKLDLNKLSPLHRAAGKGHTKVVKLLLDAGAKPDTEDNDRRTPLLMATFESNKLHENEAEEGEDDGIVAMLLAKGARVNQQNAAGDTALMQACGVYSGVPAVKAIRQLLDSGADPNLTDQSGKSAVSIVCQLDNPDLAGGITPTGTEGEGQDEGEKGDGRVPIGFERTSTETKLAILQMLKDKGARLHDFDCLEKAMWGNEGARQTFNLAPSYDIEDLLDWDKGKDRLRLGCALRMRWTPLMHATESGDAHLVDYLLRNDPEADQHVNHQDVYNRTAFHIAAIYNYDTILNMLAQRSTQRINDTDFYGYTPAWYAKSMGNVESLDVLEFYGVNEPVMYPIPPKRQLIKPEFSEDGTGLPLWIRTYPGGYDKWIEDNLYREPTEEEEAAYQERMAEKRQKEKLNEAKQLRMRFLEDPQSVLEGPPVPPPLPDGMVSMIGA